MIFNISKETISVFECSYFKIWKQKLDLVLGRSTEITRDELKFTKFVQRLRKKFTPLFTDILKTQLILKGVITLEDWQICKNIFSMISYKMDTLQN